MSSFASKPEYRRGEEAERLIADKLWHEGYSVMPCYDYKAFTDIEKPPRLYGRTAGHPVPDLDVMRAGKRFWIEVKRKGHADWTRVSARLEHGISLRLWCAYEEVQRESGCRVLLCVVEDDTREVLIETLDKIRASGLRRSEMKKVSGNEGAMYYFSRAALQPWFILSDSTPNNAP